jgi:hypothetical protein
LAKIFSDYDFYFGAVLSVFLRGKDTHYTPSLISSDNQRGRIYEFAVNNEPDFILIMSYASHPRADTADKDYDSWFFNFTDEQREKVKECFENKKSVKIALLCGRDKWNQSELAIMTNEDIAKTMYANGVVKKSITIRRDANKHSYSVFLGSRKFIPLKAQIPQ